LFALGELSRPDSLLTRSIADKAVAWPGGDLGIAEDMYTLAEVNILQMEADEALELADSALAQREAIPHEDRTDVALSRQQRGILLVRRREIDAGLTSLRAGDSLFRAEAAPDHPLTWLGSARLGSGLRIAGQWKEAEARLLQAIDEADAWLPAQHPELADARFELGLLRSDQGRWDDAERWLRTALDFQEAGLPAGHWRTARTQGALGLVLKSRDGAGEAEPMLREAYATLRERLGESHEFTAQIAAALGIRP
jgi:tetratricopeptide (TPR) repeat protein